MSIHIKLVKSMIKRILILIVLLIGSINLIAQNQYRFNNYISTQGILNPAYNGSRDIISGMLIHRQQWITFPGAPMTDALNVHGAWEGTDLGFGFTVVNDNFGFSNNLDFMAAASYKLEIDRNDKFLFFGLQMGASSMIYDGLKAVTEQWGDPVFDEKISRIFFNAGFGAYLSAEEFFVGFSVPKFFSQKFDSLDWQIRNKMDFKNLHMNIYGGYIFEIDMFKVRPSALIKYVYGAPMQIDISCSVLLTDFLWLGLAYRTTAELVFFADWAINRQFTLRYSVDYALSQFTRYAKAGSHELSLQFDFSFQKRPGMKTIRHW